MHQRITTHSRQLKQHSMKYSSMHTQYICNSSSIGYCTQCAETHFLSPARVAKVVWSDSLLSSSHSFSRAGNLMLYLSSLEGETDNTEWYTSISAEERVVRTLLACCCLYSMGYLFLYGLVISIGRATKLFPVRNKNQKSFSVTDYTHNR